MLAVKLVKWIIGDQKTHFSDLLKDAKASGGFFSFLPILS